jgi:type IV pilus assembly protein PilY1
MLWHLVGSRFGTPPHAPVALADRGTGGTQWAHKWDEATASFVLPPQSDPGRSPTGLYDYSDLGGTRGLSAGVVRVGLEPVYAVFVASSSSGAGAAPSKGIQVFAIDAATGQKLWQWQQAYTSVLVDNTAPVAPTVLMDTSGAARLYVGDMEGRVWELDAATGMNTNVVRLGPVCSVSAPCKYAALDAGATPSQPQPISTNVALARLPRAITAGTAFAGYGGELVALVGTGGADWVPDTAPGRFHALLLDKPRRLPQGVNGQRLDGSPLSAGAADTLAKAQGVLQEPTPFPLTYAGPEHIYGNITVAGRTAYFSTARSGVNDLMQLKGLTAGATYSIDLGKAATTASATATPLSGLNIANYGGVTVYFRDNGDGTSRTHVVGHEVGFITNNVLPDLGPGAPSRPDPELRVNKPAGFIYELLNWSQRFFE